MSMSSFQSLLLFNSLYLNSVCNRNNAVAVAVNSKNKQKLLETKIESDLSSSSKKHTNDQTDEKNKDNDEDDVKSAAADDALSNELDTKVSLKACFCFLSFF